MRHLVLFSLFALSVSLYGQNKSVIAKETVDTMMVSSNSAQEGRGNAFLVKLNKFKQMLNDSLAEQSLTLGLEEEKDPNIDLLIQDYVENKKFKGYRIQIFASIERLEALKMRAEFLKKYPNEKSYLIYQAPNFKVRVGDYQDRLVTHEHLAPIKIDFPSAFIVKDEIEPTIK